MNNVENVYALQGQKSQREIRYLFISRGKRNITKVVQYSFLREFNGRSFYNLGFGDYYLDKDILIDDISSNNRDVYKVFNSVLQTIPMFFKLYPNSILLVQGSDGRSEFTEKCRFTCSKKCAFDCRNFNRRINIYQRWLDKNYDKLVFDYQFIGSIYRRGKKNIPEEYKPGKKYDTIFLLKRNV